MTEEEKVRKINPYGQVAILNATIIDLEKENAELKKETKRLSAVDKTNELLLKHQNSLKKEVHDLRKENEELKEQMGRAGYRIAELKMQIEKMKCCENCKHHYWNYGDLDCRLKYSCYDTNYDKWELAK